MDVKSSTSIGALKRAFQARDGAPINNQRLMCGGQILSNDNTCPLSHAGICNEDTVELQLDVRGGCGIVAYIGNRKAKDVLVKGLKRLEYRGYDSAGIGVITTEKKVGIVKKLGKVINLDNAVEGSPDDVKDATLGIGHTRWATHGVPSDRNSHPHANGDQTLCVVHNGIIENYATLKQGLQQKGYEFRSDTDTEVLAHLVDEIRARSQLSLSFEEAVGLALCQVHGTFGVCFVDAKNPDVLVGARHGSPLILGLGENEEEFFLASDAAAIVEYTRQVVYLEEGDIVTITRGKGYEISSLHSSRASYDSAMFDALMRLAEEKGDTEDLRHKGAQRKTDTLEMSLAAIEKGGKKHFMLKEVMEQPAVSFFIFDRATPPPPPFPVPPSHTPALFFFLLPGSPLSVFPCNNATLYICKQVLRNCMRGRVNSDANFIQLGGVLHVMDRLVKARRFVICACGTSWHSGLVGEYLIEEMARVPVEVEYASEFRYRKPILYPDDVVIVISQSGETADTLAAVREAKRQGCLTLGFVNSVGSTIARETDAGCYLHVGPEIGVASTKAFTGQIMVLTMFALMLAKHKQTLPEETISEYLKVLESIPEKCEKVLKQCDVRNFSLFWTILFILLTDL